MVRELQVRTAALNIEAGAKPVGCDGGALNMPSRAARTKRRIPGRFAFTVRAPNQSVKRIALAGAIRVATALGKEGLHLLAGVIRLVAEVLRGLNGGINIRVLRIVDDVGRIGVEKRLHHLRNLVDGLHRPHKVIRGEHGEQLHV